MMLQIKKLSIPSVIKVLVMSLYNKKIVMHTIKQTRNVFIVIKDII